MFTMTGKSFDAFLEEYESGIGSLARRAKELILTAGPDLQEMVDPPSKIVAYGFSSKYRDLVCAIAPYQSHLNLMFSRGAELPDPEHLLTGTGKRARHIKASVPEDLENPGVLALLIEAVNRAR